MSFEGLWHRHEFELQARGEEGPNLCVYAHKFNTWAQELCVGATNDPSIVSINQAKVLLVDKYMEWRSFVPKRHRTYTGHAHICIFHVFEITYDRLKVVELSLSPPMLFLPSPPVPPPPPPPPPQIAGVFIGEIEDE
jgi:hypothetical protein